MTGNEIRFNSFLPTDPISFPWCSVEQQGINLAWPNVTLHIITFKYTKFSFRDLLIWRCLQVYKDSLLITGIDCGPVCH